MLNRKYNNNRWRMELDELEEMPEDIQSNNNALWATLENRLIAAKGSRITFRFWAAAACTIAFILFAGIRLNDNSNQRKTVHIQLPVNTNPTLFKESVPVLVIKDNRSIRSPFNNTANLVSSSPKSKRYLVKKQSAINFVDAPIELFTESNDSMAKQSITLLTNMPKPIIFTSLRKHLPVVHINDLEKPITMNQAVAENNDQHSLKVRLFGKEMSPDNATNNHNGIINIRLNRFPQN